MINWVPTYLHTVFNMEQSLIGLYLTCAYGGQFAVGLIASALADKMLAVGGACYLFHAILFASLSSTDTSRCYTCLTFSPFHIIRKTTYTKPQMASCCCTYERCLFYIWSLACATLNVFLYSAVGCHSKVVAVGIELQRLCVSCADHLHNTPHRDTSCMVGCDGKCAARNGRRWNLLCAKRNFVF